MDGYVFCPECQSYLGNDYWHTHCKYCGEHVQDYEDDEEDE